MESKESVYRKTPNKIKNYNAWKGRKGKLKSETPNKKLCLHNPLMKINCHYDYIGKV